MFYKYLKSSFNIAFYQYVFMQSIVIVYPYVSLYLTLSYLFYFYSELCVLNKRIINQCILSIVLSSSLAGIPIDVIYILK